MRARNLRLTRTTREIIEREDAAFAATEAKMSEYWDRARHEQRQAMAEKAGVSKEIATDTAHQKWARLLRHVKDRVRRKFSRFLR